MPCDVAAKGERALKRTAMCETRRSEVLSSSDGHRGGPGYAELLEKLYQETTEPGKARSEPFQIIREAPLRGDGAKAFRDRRNDPGRKKPGVKRKRGEAAVNTMVGESVRQGPRDRPDAAVEVGVSDPGGMFPS